MTNDLTTLMEILREMGVKYDAGEKYLRINRDSMIEKFPGEPNTLPEDRIHGSYDKCNAALAKTIGGRVLWSKFDDDWYVIETIIRKEA